VPNYDRCRSKQVPFEADRSELEQVDREEHHNITPRPDPAGEPPWTGNFLDVAKVLDDGGGAAHVSEEYAGTTGPQNVAEASGGVDRFGALGAESYKGSQEPPQSSPSYSPEVG
jgi:hypothetical protein